ncbi:MAG: ribose 5-phosphate isomerase B [Pyrinomonadaceae bacterium]
MSDERQTRDRVRALVREVLNNALPAEEDTGSSAPIDERRTTASSDAPNLQQQNALTNESRTARISNIAPASASDENKIVERDESAKMVLTEADVRGLERGARLRIAEGARLTPLAADIVREQNIELVRRPARRGSAQAKMIALGADHGGFEMKEELKKFLDELGHRTRDFGTNSTDAVDYPDFAHAVARAVADKEADLGIVIDGAGVGSAMTANKVPGVRAAACYSIDVARNSREHNDANVLTLGSKTITNDLMRDIVRAWLATEISEERHRKRVAKIETVERQYQC